MSPRKKLYKSPNERTAASRSRRQAKGERQVQIWLSGDAVKKLDDLVKKQEAASRGSVIEGLILKAKI